jgi:hypothetical protein
MLTTTGMAPRAIKDFLSPDNFHNRIYPSNDPDAKMSEYFTVARDVIQLHAF